MANPEHVDILRRGVSAWNEWRYSSRQNNLVPDLAGARFSDMALFDADLSGAILEGTDFSGSGLIGANLRSAKLRGANLTRCHLPMAILCSADLTEANLTKGLFGATILGETNLRDSIGLETCIHNGKSFLDFATLFISGNLPLEFLRGCGLPDHLIKSLPSLLSKAIQCPSCFISYSTKDQEFTDRLHADLQNNGVRCWFAPHDVRSGKKLQEQIDEAIRLHDRLLLILSDASMKSEWVKTEIAHARQKELNERRQVLFPIGLVPFEAVQRWEYFDADIGKDSAREIREYFIPDFSSWKDHNSYQVALQRLLKDLKAGEGGKRNP